LKALVAAGIGQRAFHLAGGEGGAAEGAEIAVAAEGGGAGGGFVSPLAAAGEGLTEVGMV
jgi:hypothetical protein